MDSHVLYTRNSNFWVSLWIQPQYALSNMNIIFLNDYILLFHAPTVQIYFFKKNTKKII